MEVRLLGPFEVWVGGAPLAIGGATRRALLALLALHAGRDVGRERLVEGLWGARPPRTAPAMVQAHVAALRKALPAGVLVTTGDGYRLDVPPGAVDLVRAEGLAAEAREARARGDADRASTVLRRALALWRGPALAELSEPFADAERRRIEDLRLRLVEERGDLQRGRHATPGGGGEAAAEDPVPREHRVRFCRAPDGVGIAYAVHGEGPPLVKSSNWMTHLEHDWRSPVWRHWLEGLSSGRTLVRYDERGSGLSDREVEDVSLEAWVGDLEAVVDALGLERFALLGISGGGPVAIAYAARHPARVSHLVLYGSFARGRLRRGGGEGARREAETLITLPSLGWGRANPAFRRLFTTLFVPDATREQMDWFDELQRVSTSPEMAVRMRRGRAVLDVSDLAREVRAPALVAHAREDAAAPFAEGRRLATLLPDAQFLALESRNHILLADEPAWPRFLSALDGFLAAPGAPRTPAPRPAGLDDLTAREREVLRLVADGLGNEAIAAALHLSVRTVERHLANAYGRLGVSGRGARAAAAARYTLASRGAPGR